MIANGDWYYKNKQLELTRESYIEALNYHPDQPYPAMKLNEVTHLSKLGKRTDIN